MSRVKKQLHEWDENLKDDSLPTNVVGRLLLRASREAKPLRLSSLSFLPFVPPLILSSLRPQTSPTGWLLVCPSMTLCDCSC